MIGLVGKSGSGKSTLIELMMGFLKPSKGEILIDNKNIFQHLREWRNQLATLPKKIILKMEQFLKYCSWVIRRKYNDQIDACVDVAQLNLFTKDLDKGLKPKLAKGEYNYQTVKEKEQRLQELCIVTHKYFLDEATNSLDKDTEKNF